MIVLPLFCDSRQMQKTSSKTIIFQIQDNYPNPNSRIWGLQPNGSNVCFFSFPSLLSFPSLCGCSVSFFHCLLSVGLFQFFNLSYIPACLCSAVSSRYLNCRKKTIFRFFLCLTAFRGLEF